MLDGKPVRFASTADAARHGIGIVFQELNLFPNLSVAENIFIAREAYPRRHRHRRAAAAARRRGR